MLLKLQKKEEFWKMFLLSAEKQDENKINSKNVGLKQNSVTMYVHKILLNDLF